MKKKYFMHGFDFLVESYKKYLTEYTFHYDQANSWRYDFASNFLHTRKLKKTGKLLPYDVLHCNNWASTTNLIPNKDQVSISHWHGFSFGIDVAKGLEDSTWPHRMAGRFFGSLVQPRIQDALQKYDLVYAAIPNILSSLKKVRSDAQWIPNPINTQVFNPCGPKETFLGDPAIFFPTRFHKMKTPEIGMNIFRKIKQTFPKAKLHLIRYPERFSQYNLYKRLFREFKQDIIWHDFIPRNELPARYRGVDLVIGSFGKGLLSLVELESMACKTAVVSHDDYEIIKTELDDLPLLAVKILENPQFKKHYIEKCFNHVKEVHGEQNVVDKHRKNLNSVS